MTESYLLSLIGFLYKNTQLLFTAHIFPATLSGDGEVTTWIDFLCEEIIPHDTPMLRPFQTIWKADIPTIEHLDQGENAKIYNCFSVFYMLVFWITTNKTN